MQSCSVAEVEELARDFSSFSADLIQRIKLIQLFAKRLPHFSNIPMVIFGCYRFHPLPVMSVHNTKSIQSRCDALYRLRLVLLGRGSLGIPNGSGLHVQLCASAF